MNIGGAGGGFCLHKVVLCTRRVGALGGERAQWVHAEHTLWYTHVVHTMLYTHVVHTMLSETERDMMKRWMIQGHDEEVDDVDA